MQKTENLRVESITRLKTPQDLKTRFPASETALETVLRGRSEVRNVLDRSDKRMLLIIGPCSIHDPEAALDYAKRLAALRDEVQDKILIVMRVYFEKPRTTVGWKGFINDPHLDDSCDMKYGLRTARKLMLDILELGLPIAAEFLDPIVPQYMADLVSWAAIGARTVESQTHREMASGLSMPVGLKNTTDGGIQRAIDAILACRAPHSFLGIDQAGHSSIIKTTGNPYTHLVLRGGGGTTNYHADEVAAAAEKLRAAGLSDAMMVDCSHANSGKVPARQADVWKELLEQRQNPDCPVVGAMIESFIEEGNQPISDNLKYGLSITDGCMSWEMTESLLRSVVE
ncbi:3-deoxy-7-phosphoheptulonate synthase [Tichowtungia aerotolerans]|uniref:3-deoxy-7-phosphoheptulonate synthase n=1 Tax=Tichowtungia aerotolerans TaxID=2697043 RepID=UPI0022B91853|nr:3-deoxy-7-phosphoheptulonate synthase [Tichowtungia aerotolerans]